MRPVSPTVAHLTLVAVDEAIPSGGRVEGSGRHDLGRTRTIRF
jgi:hypothetical protein